MPVMEQTPLHRWAHWMRASGHSDKTIRTRVSQVATLCRAVSLSDPTLVTTDHLVDWLAACDAAWTRRTYWATARAWCRWMILVGLREDDPSAPVPRPRAPQAVPHPVSWVLINRLLADPPSVRVYSYLVLACFAGLRCHEIARVRGEDLDVEGGWLYVDSKGGQRAAVPLHEMIARVAIGMDPVGYWYPGTDGGHVHAAAVSRAVSRAFTRIGSQATAHSARHTFGTSVLRSSHDLRVTQELLRHRSLASTQIYTEVASADKVAAVNSLGHAS